MNLNFLSLKNRIISNKSQWYYTNDRKQWQLYSFTTADIMVQISRIDQLQDLKLSRMIGALRGEISGSNRIPALHYHIDPKRHAEYRGEWSCTTKARTFFSYQSFASMSKVIWQLLRYLTPPRLGVRMILLFILEFAHRSALLRGL